jgi:hypothetical protein
MQRIDLKAEVMKELNSQARECSYFSTPEILKETAG